MFYLIFGLFYFSILVGLITLVAVGVTWIVREFREFAAPDANVRRTAKVKLLTRTRYFLVTVSVLAVAFSLRQALQRATDEERRGFEKAVQAERRQ